MAKEKKKSKLKIFAAYYVPNDELEEVIIEAKDLKEAKKRARDLLRTEDYLMDMCLDAVIEKE